MVEKVPHGASFHSKQPLITKIITDLRSCRAVTYALHTSGYRNFIHVPNEVYSRIFQEVFEHKWRPSIEIHHNQEPGDHLRINCIDVYPTHWDGNI